MRLIPKSGMILVRPISTQPAASGPIQLADVYDVPETTGEVVALAERFACPDCGAMKAPQVEAGDLVLFPPSAGSEITVNGATYLLLREDDVLAIVADETKCEVVT